MGVGFRMTAVVLDTSAPQELATFYETLLGWRRVADRSDWVKLRSPDDAQGLSFQLDRSYAPPQWPSTPGEQRMMAHLDIAVDDLERAVEQALELGADLQAFQPQDHVRVMRDPAGHPFCLYIEEAGSAASAGPTAPYSEVHGLEAR
jgi:catechol 2,3-dioxygenase-like lactoylglutathione lyase family enzyme